MTLNEYNSCVDKFSDGVFRFILKNIRDTEIARDVVQDAFVRLWEHVKEIGFDKAKAFLFTTAYRLMIDHIRKFERQEAYETVHDNMMQTHNTFSDLKEVLDEALQKLPEIQRTVLLLRDYEGYSYEEIGEISRLSEAQVKVYIFRARTFLKQYIGNLELVV